MKHWKEEQKREHKNFSVMKVILLKSETQVLWQPFLNTDTLVN